MSTRLFVGNLAFHATQEIVSQCFAGCGGVVSVSVAADRETGRSRGFAFVDMADDAAACRAIAELNGKNLEGRLLHVRAELRKQPGRGMRAVSDRSDRSSGRGR